MKKIYLFKLIGEDIEDGDNNDFTHPFYTEIAQSKENLLTVKKNCSRKSSLLRARICSKNFLTAEICSQNLLAA